MIQFSRKHIAFEVCYKLTEKMSARGNISNKEKKENFPDNRGQAILSAIVSEHLTSGQPVGSKVIADKFEGKSGLSSATIRNVMSELEARGLLEQPHTSAGRVPTDEGYLFYVDNLLGVLSLSNEDLRLINEELGLGDLDGTETPERLMERTSQLLSALSNNIGIVVSLSMLCEQRIIAVCRRLSNNAFSSCINPRISARITKRLFPPNSVLR